MERYDTFEKVCEQLGITYTFPPEYYRQVTRRWLAKKAFCIKVELPARLTSSVYTTNYSLKALSGNSDLFGLEVDVCKPPATLPLHPHSSLCVFSQVFKEVQKRKAEQRQKKRKSAASTNTVL